MVDGAERTTFIYTERQSIHYKNSTSELGSNAQHQYLYLITKIKGGKRVVFPFLISCKRSIVYVNDLLTYQKITGVIDRVYQPEHIVDAFNCVISGQKTGNAILSMS